MLPSMPELNPIRLPCVLLHGQAVGHGKVFAITARFRLTALARFNPNSANCGSRAVSYNHASPGGARGGGAGAIAKIN